MSSLVAKRYVKALLGTNDVAVVYNELAQISTAFLEDKFVSIIGSTDITKSAKLNLIFSFVDNCSETSINLIKLLSENKRLNIIPSIVAELKQELAVINNTYTGVIHTNKELSADYVSKLEISFSKKFDTTLTLTQNICDYDGIKVDLEGLGCEIGFSKDRLKSQMINHILKAV